MNTPHKQHPARPADDAPTDPVENGLDELGASLRRAMPEGLAEQTARDATRISRASGRARPSAPRYPRLVLAIAGPLAAAATLAIAAILWQGVPALGPIPGSPSIVADNTADNAADNRANDQQTAPDHSLAAAAAELEAWLLTMSAADPSETTPATGDEQMQAIWSTDPVLTGEVSF